MINEKQAKLYCGEDLSLIENWDRAVADRTQIWDLHHKLEIMPWGTYSIKNLKDNGLYYKQPAASLVFMTRSEHLRLHSRNRSAETRRKLSEAKRGEPPTYGMLGKHHSQEAKRKMSESLKEAWKRRKEARKEYYRKRRESQS